MPDQPASSPTRAFISLSELAEDVLGLSRARVYELIERGALPRPIYDVRTRRPLFDADLQRTAIAVRQTGVGIDGSAVIFYRRGRHAQRLSPAAHAPTRSRRRATPGGSPTRYDELVGSLQALGVSNADERSVAAAVAECFPHGIEDQQEADVIRALFRVLRS